MLFAMPSTKAIRSAALTFIADPFLVGSAAAFHYESDALILIEDGNSISQNIATIIPTRIP